MYLDASMVVKFHRCFNYILAFILAYMLASRGKLSGFVIIRCTCLRALKYEKKSLLI